LDLGDGLRLETALHDTVVIEDGHAVGREPDVTFDTRRPEPEGQRKRLEGVLGGISPRTTMSKPDHVRRD
jgi:hypothetical protein